ncbi:MAG: hypothetical protein JRJ56_01270 [Deltaproteobacteria bacterium]|nr:hypothetical protein [Deltaproteobacteria bacterium]
MIKTLRRQAPGGGMLLLNVGNLTKPSIRKDFAVMKKQVEVITACYRQLGADLLAPGLQELAYGDDIINTMVKAAGGSLPLLCTNLEKHSPAMKAFRDYLLLEKGGRRILLTSLLDPAMKRKAIHPLAIGDPAASLRQIQAAVPHDLSVVILHLADRKARTLLQQVKGVDIAILAAQRGTLPQPEMVGKTVLLKNNNHGKTIGYLDWSFARRQPVKAALVELEKKRVDPDPRVEKQVAAVEAWLRQHYIDLEKSGRGADSKLTSTYVGVKKCGSCHAKIVADWQQTRHARAYASLQKKCRDYCPDCLPCHVTGKKNPQNGVGFLSPQKTPHLFNVQCEQCHGAADRHLQDPEKPYGALITPDTCVTCHTPQTDPEFSYEKDINLISH